MKLPYMMQRVISSPPPQLTQIISDKEKKSHSYQSGKLDALSEEKANKIKKFSKEYIAKLLRRMEKSGSKSTHTTDPRSRKSHYDRDKHPSRSNSQPDGPSGSGTHEAPSPEAADQEEPEIDVNDTLDLGLDLEDYHDDLDDFDDSGDPSPATDVNAGPEPAITVVIRDHDTDNGMRHREKYLSPSTSTPISDTPLGNGLKPKRSRWDQKPGEVLPSIVNPESLYDGL